MVEIRVSVRLQMAVVYSGSTLACCARGPRFESRCGQKFVFSRKSLRYAALGTGCTVTAVPRSTQPSTLRGTVNEYQQYGWVIIPIAMGECSVYSSPQADSKVKFVAWCTSSLPPGADRLSPRGTKVNSRIMAGAVDDSTINIVVVIIIIISSISITE